MQVQAEATESQNEDRRGSWPLKKRPTTPFVAVQEALAAALAERARREQAVAAAKDALAAAKADVAAKQSQLATTKSDLNDRWSNDFTIASLKPLTPEQMCWTVFRVTGVYDRTWQAEVAELDKAKPLTEEQKKDPKQIEAPQRRAGTTHLRQAESRTSAHSSRSTALQPASRRAIFLRPPIRPCSSRTRGRSIAGSRPPPAMSPNASSSKQDAHAPPPRTSIMTVLHSHADRRRAGRRGKIL